MELAKYPYIDYVVTCPLIILDITYTADLPHKARFPQGLHQLCAHACTRTRAQSTEHRSRDALHCTDRIHRAACTTCATRTACDTYAACTCTHACAAHGCGAVRCGAVRCGCAALCAVLCSALHCVYAFNDKRMD